MSNEKVKATMTELGVVARELMRLDAMADRASHRGDADALLEVGGQMAELHVRFAVNYRALLVHRMRTKRPEPAAAAASGRGLRESSSF